MQTSTSNESHDYTIGHLRNVLPLFTRFNISATPCNYALLYEYVCGSNLALNRKIDLLIRDKQSLTDDICRGLYDEFVCEFDEKKLGIIQKEVINIMSEVSGIISNAGNNASAYEDTLSSSEEKLTGTPSLEIIIELVSYLREGAQSLQSQSKELRKQLDTKFEEVNELQKDLEAVKQQAELDFLTGISNRKVLDKTLERLTGENKIFCMAMVDIDHFKKFNDTHGHLVGDQVLRSVAIIIKENIKGHDILARYGGEEFAIVFTDTQLAGGATASEHINEAISRTNFINKKLNQSLGVVSVSIGVTQFKPGETPEEIIARADKALYAAKEGGRNRVVAAQ